MIPLQAQVRVRTISGTSVGVVVGRAFSDPPRYDVRTREGVQSNVPADRVMEFERA